MTLSHCSTCGTALSGRSICPRCGTLVGAEVAIASATARARSLIENQVARLGPFGPTQFLWVAAFTPIVMAPPIVSLVLSVGSMRRADRTARSANYEWIAIISLLNIILSGIVLYKFHFSPAELLDYALNLARSWIGHILPALPGHGPAPPRIVPI